MKEHRDDSASDVIRTTKPSVCSPDYTVYSVDIRPVIFFCLLHPKAKIEIPWAGDTETAHDSEFV